MAERMQVIDMAKIRPMAKRIDSISYDNGSDQIESDLSISSPVSGKGTVSIENRIVGDIKSESGEISKKLSLEVKISAADGSPYYSLDIVASGLYQAPSDSTEEEAEDMILTDGFQDLYAYIRNIACIIMSGGPFSEPAMPILNVRMGRG